jgi:acetolactate synthase-1/2/3 large subunit
LQDLAHVDMMRPITKFATSVPSTERVADFVAMAARESFNGSFGPSYLEIPRDVLDFKVDLMAKAVIPRKRGKYRASTKSIGDPAGIEALADLLVKAKKPAILLGQQVWTCGGSANRARVRREAQHSDVHERCRPRHARARSSAELSTDAPRCVR